MKFGGGKVIRDGMGQSQITRAGGAMDTVITNALIVDWTGIYKADVGLRDGRIARIGKAGQPRYAARRRRHHRAGDRDHRGRRAHPDGGGDGRAYPLHRARSRSTMRCIPGITTMLGGGTGPAHGTLATTCTPGPWHI